MSALRITDRSMATTVLAGLQGNLSRLAETQQHLSSGKLISRPSDSPTGTVSAMQFRGEIRRMEQYARNADDGIGWLATADKTLTSALDQVRRVRDLTLQGMSAGVAGAANAREALAVEIDSLRESLISLANTTYLDRPVFGGTTAGAAAYGPGGTYIGDAGVVDRTVGGGATVRVHTSGTAVFGTDLDPVDPSLPNSTQLFNVLADIATHLRADPAAAGFDPDALSGDLGNLDTAMNRMVSQLADVGARYSRTNQMREIADGRIIDLKMQLSGVEDIDLPKTITDLQLRQTAYQAALGAAARIVQPSLIDFLR
jgi:flagellar hook-associated protein 3 FlgL